MTSGKILHLSDYRVKICVFSTSYYISFNAWRIHEINIISDSIHSSFGDLWLVCKLVNKLNLFLEL